MAVTIQTGSPKTVIATLKKAIDDGKAPTWSYDKDGDFTHTPPQWKNKAWMRPRITANGVDVNIVKPQGETITWEIYAIYHGRFIELAINHAHDDYSVATASPKPVSGDVV